MSTPTFLFDSSDPQMLRANAAARETFKYFWREVSWERRRIIPALGLIAVKFPFTDGPRNDEAPDVEQMWVGDVDFDGDTVTGQLLNAPSRLQSISQGDSVAASVNEVQDWMIASDGKVIGAHTVNLMRSRMSAAQRREHDQAWGLDFGSPSEIQVELSRLTEPPRKPGFIAGLFGKKQERLEVSSVFQDHPRCVNMLGRIEEQLKSHPQLARDEDEDGWTLLHRDALAGNFGIVRLLLAHGADRNATTSTGRTAADLAKSIGWVEIAQYLETFRDSRTR